MVNRKMSETHPPKALWPGHGQRHSPSTLLFQLGAEEQVGEQKDVAQLAGPLHQLHHEAVLQQLPVLWAQCGQAASQGDGCGGELGHRGLWAQQEEETI